VIESSVPVIVIAVEQLGIPVAEEDLVLFEDPDSESVPHNRTR
jgi:hypothetical protein